VGLMVVVRGLMDESHESDTRQGHTVHSLRVFLRDVSNEMVGERRGAGL
jgi:hypothetical protein